MKKALLIGLPGIVLFAAMLFSVPARVQNPPGPKFNHYKVYNVDNIDYEESLKLKLRFEESPRKAQISTLVHFANPVSKNDEGMADETAHLTWYKLGTDDVEPQRTVTFKNQFGIQKWVLGQPILLVVPAEKNDEGTPEGIDHYKAYEVLDVTGDKAEASVSLVDQWFDQKTQLGDPIWYCIPVSKKRENERLVKINHFRSHLAVYKIAPMGIDNGMKFTASDQFMSADLVAKRSMWLCVPSRIKELETAQQDQTK